ncbi:fumarate reductase/succinate dehydrogenase flavoprotein domain protein [Ilyonectria robusta]|uniref:fumarate reductase/succinate dehydrogenase flavoprotein domain protein n=1 Tax=Ilyonectria robusta TaxID=1079257 RepID=UPI001E8EAFA7|nr:fumarate reductase/succinate dehydrogenase flavoprotein domain protein [Ilyonectria robusta]KAH8649777.1 fumarate reductase/succinate dehydrogenase flavoprotein domain protein [Ilyonectria robusta]
MPTAQLKSLRAIAASRLRRQDGLHPLTFSTATRTKTATSRIQVQIPPGTLPKNYDLIVVGYGIAGASAAISAAEKGASVLVLDRGHGGGSSALSGGVFYAGGGTPYQKAAGYDETSENMFNYLKEEVDGVIDDTTLKRFCEGSPARVAWLEKHGATFGSSLCDYKTSFPTDRHYLYFSGNEKAHLFNLRANPAPRGHRQLGKGMAGGVLWRSLRDSAQALGVTFQPLSRVDHLIVDDDGRIGGVRYTTMLERGWRFRLHRLIADWGKTLFMLSPPTGRIVNGVADVIWRRSAETKVATSQAGVVISSGGFAANLDMVREHLPQFVLTSPLGTEGDDGAGICLGESVGGSVGCMDRVNVSRFIAPPSAFLQGIAVSVDGRRILNEDVYGSTFTSRMIRNFDGRGFLIVDDETWKRARAQVKSESQLFQLAQSLYIFSIGHRKAKTLEELATKLGISRNGLVKTVKAYNDAITAGVDDPARKAKEQCKPIQRGPFYGVDLSLRKSLIYPIPAFTLGGLKVDGSSGLVLNKAGQEIQGLYAAGRSAVGICSNSYVSGLSLADGVFSGHRAGVHAASCLPQIPETRAGG